MNQQVIFINSVPWTYRGLMIEWVEQMAKQIRTINAPLSRAA